MTRLFLEPAIKNGRRENINRIAQPSKRVWGYVLAVVLVALATWLKYLAQPKLIPADVPTLYFMVIVPVAIYFGFGPSILVCILSLLAWDFFFLPPGYTFINLGDIVNAPVLVLFLAVGTATSYLASNLHRQRDKLRTANRELLSQIDVRKNAEEELKRSEKKYSTIVERGNDGIIIIQDGKIVFANNRMAEITGFSLEENLGKPFLDIAVPDSRPLLAERYENRMKGRPVTDRYETALLHKNGGIILVDVSTSVIEHEGSPATMSIIRDITEKSRLLEELMAQDRLASVGLMVAGVSHEIKNPLTSVIGFSDLLLKKEVTKDIAEDLKVINDEAKRILEIVNNLLAFARKQPEGKVAIQINEQINKVLALRVHEQTGSNIHVISRLAPDLPLVMGNSSQMLQVFLNLIVNAEQAMLEAHNKGTLTIMSEQAGQIVRVSIADDGPGISRENMKKLFIPFFTIKPTGKGNGLGLSICHGIVTEHGGNIYAESELGKGATFIVELPVATGSK